MIRLASFGWLLCLATVSTGQQRDLIIEEGGLRGGFVRPGPFGGPAVPQQVFQPVPGAFVPPPGSPLPPDGIRLRPIRPPAPSPSVPPKPDRHGDLMPSGAIARFGTIRLRHGPEPIALAFSPDGKLLASLSSTEDGVRLWDVTSGKEVARLEMHVTFAAICNDGRMIVADGDKCKVWTPSLKTIRDLPDGTLPEGTNTLAVAPDNLSFAAGCAKKVVLIDLQTGKPKAELKTPIDQPPLRLVYSPDGRWLAGSGQNKAGVWLWDLKTNKRVRTYSAQADYSEFCFSPDGNRLAIGGENLRVVPTDSEETIEGFRSPPDVQCFGVRFGPDGKELFALQIDGTVLKLSAETGEIKDSWAPRVMNLRNPLVLSLAADRVAAVDQYGGIRIWDPKTGKGSETERLPALYDPGFSTDGKTASALDQNAHIHIFDPVTGKPGQAIELPVEEFTPAVYDARSGLAAVMIGGESFEIQIIEVSTKKVLTKIGTNGNAFPSVAFSPADRDRFAVFMPGTVTVHSVATGRPIRTIDVGHADDVNPRGCFSPDGRLLAITTRPLSVWELATGKKRFEIDTVNDPVGVVFSSDGRYIAAWDNADMIVVIDVRTGSAIRRFRTSSGDASVGAAVFSPDGKRLVTGGFDGVITMWDVATGEPVINLDRHDGAVTGLAFSPNGKRLLSSATDGTVLVWDLEVKFEAKEVAAVAGLDEAYRLLGSPDPAQAARGQDFLYRRPAEGVKMLAEKIVVSPPTPSATITRYLADLGNEDYQTRRAAVSGLVGIGGESTAAVRMVAENSPNPEVRKLAQETLGQLEASPTNADDLRIIRAVEVLENLARTEPAQVESRNVLRKWASGPRGHRLTVEAASAIARLEPTKP